jgi:hypothetical protein
MITIFMPHNIHHIVRLTAGSLPSVFDIPGTQRLFVHSSYIYSIDIANSHSFQYFSITANIHDPYVFRNTLLIAGLHYVWNVGDLSSFDSNFLFHKVQSIRTINTWIEECSSSTLTLCVRHIATLCVVEVCLPYIPSRY